MLLPVMSGHFPFKVKIVDGVNDVVKEGRLHTSSIVLKEADRLRALVIDLDDSNMTDFSVRTASHGISKRSGI